MNKFVAKALKFNVDIDTLVLEPRSLDSAIVGTRIKNGKMHIMYSYNRLVGCFIVDDGMSEEEAIDWIEYNTLRALPYMAGMKCAEPVVRRERY